jgi:hypothetical protein
MNDSLQRQVEATDRRTAAVVYLPFVHDHPEADVERINSYALYDVGKAFRAIEAMPDDFGATVPARDAFFAATSAHYQISQLLQGKPFPLGISRSKAAAFRTALAAVLETHFSEDDGRGGRKRKYPDPNTAPINGWDFWNARRTLTEFETVFAEENERDRHLLCSSPRHFLDSRACRRCRRIFPRSIAW